MLGAPGRRIPSQACSALLPTGIASLFSPPGEGRPARAAGGKAPACRHSLPQGRPCEAAGGNTPGWSSALAELPAHATPCRPPACRRWQLRTCESRSRRAARKPWELDDFRTGDQLVRPRRPFWSPPKRCDLLVRCAAGGRFLTPFRAHLFGETFWFGGRGAAIVTLTSLHVRL